MKMPSVLEDVPLDKIVLDTGQARQRDTAVEADDDLARSIRKHGLISPIVVRRLESGQYQMLAGQRRFRAHEALKLPAIRARVVDQSVGEHAAKALSLIENVARKDVKEADLVDAVQFFIEKYNSTTAVAGELGLHPDTVRKYARAARLPREILADVRRNEYKLGDALKALQALGDDKASVDAGMLRETALEMEKLSPQAKKKFIEIRKREPESAPGAAAAKAKRRAEAHKIDLRVTDDQLERMGAYKRREGIAGDGDAASELLDLGLDAAGV